VSTCNCPSCYERRGWEAPRVTNPHPDTLCYCCGAADDPNGDGPAINTGFCAECQAAHCADEPAGSPCSVVQ
jgi:hypothetical protein